ncbi:MAG TPA: hypothetical protein VFK38_03645 [Candidatus Limnocylindrales bacterium]|nr:hypothetical protein [Candidatus Limnocylindrales bacterium]
MDFYFNSWRLVPANLVWAAFLALVVGVGLIWPVGALLVAPLLALPTVGLFRLAALIGRGHPVSFSDALVAWRRYGLPALESGAILTLMTTVLLVDLSVGLASPDPVGIAFATAAFWGWLASWAVGLVFWALLVDPEREGEGPRAAARLAALLVVAHPIRIGALLLVGALLLAASAVLLAALLTVSVAFVALAATRYVLPAADRLEGRATVRQDVGDVAGEVMAAGPGRGDAVRRARRR